MVWLMALAWAESPSPPDWLSGCWVSTITQRPYQETWVGPHGGVSVGAALMGKPEKPGWEHLWLGPVDGVLTYVATPSGQERTAFAATTVEKDHLVFENPAHDFPKRIEYTHEDGKLRVDVSAREGNEAHGFILKMERCPKR